MKKLFLFAIAVLLVCGCTDSGIDETPYGGSDNTENPGDGNDSEDEKPDIPEYSINGSVQKGQFIQGSVVTIQELNERLQPTGKSYQTQILDDMGSFELTSDIDSRYVEIIAEGFYFNEVTGNLSDAPLTLRSLSDLAMEGKSNVNLLTSLETPPHQVPCFERGPDHSGCTPDGRAGSAPIVLHPARRTSLAGRLRQDGHRPSGCRQRHPAGYFRHAATRTNGCPTLGNRFQNRDRHRGERTDQRRSPARSRTEQRYGD